MSENNPLLEKLKLPGRIFQLPSRGIFYKNGELDSSIREAEVHIHSMSALDEIHMKNPDQLFSGDAVKAVFKSCVSGINLPNQLLSKDVDAILLFLRTVTYGPAYEFSAAHSCENAKDHTYVADIDQMISDMKTIDPTVIEDMYHCTLNNGQVIRLRPTRYQQTVDFVKNNGNKAEITVEDEKKNLVSMLLGVIDSVDDVTDEKFIEEWISKIPSPMVNRMADKIEKINDWGSDLLWTCKCRDCGENFKVEIPINPVSFFTE